MTSEIDVPAGRGLHSFRFQLNLSSSLHRVTQLNPERVLEWLKFSYNVNECKPLPAGSCAFFTPSQFAAEARVAATGAVQVSLAEAGGAAPLPAWAQLQVDGAVAGPAHTRPMTVCSWCTSIPVHTLLPGRTLVQLAAHLLQHFCPETTLHYLM